MGFSVYSFDLGLVTSPTHLISTSVPRGSDLTATHLNLVSNKFEVNEANELTYVLAGLTSPQ